MESTTESDQRWLPVPGFEDRYEVSDQGRVRSLPITLNRGGAAYRKRGQILNPSYDAVGRARVTLYRHGGGKRQAFVHRVVLEAFVGPCPSGMECCHFNDIPGDNRLSNLRWDTHSANQFDKVRNGGDHNASKAQCANGHEFTPENTYEQTTGGRGCKECQRVSIRKYMRKVRSKPIEKGFCTKCRKPKESAQFKLCSPCRDYQRERARHDRARCKGQDA